MNKKYLKPKFVLNLVMTPDEYSSQIFKTSTYKKNLKNILKGHQHNILELLVTLEWIRTGLPMPKSLDKHIFSDSGLIDVHIDPDWLLLYKVDGRKITLINTGNHNTLF